MIQDTLNHSLFGDGKVTQSDKELRITIDERYFQYIYGLAS